MKQNTPVIVKQRKQQGVSGATHSLLMHCIRTKCDKAMKQLEWM
jgi:hypothetical protein